MKIALGLIAATVVTAVMPYPSLAGDWHLVEPGLEFAQLRLPVAADVGDSRVSVLRIDPSHFALRLLNASAPGQGQSLSARDWCQRADLVAAINASMYQTDLVTSVSLMRTRTHVNNARLTKDRAVLAFDRLSDEVPSVDIIDRTCQDLETLQGKYSSLVQSIRMVSCKGENKWEQQPKRWSTAAIAIDRRGRVLFLHCRSPYSTHDLIDGLLALPLDISKAMYVEGGPEAQIYARSGEFEIERVGVFESGFVESDEKPAAWPVPNVIGVVRR